jgi:hypothetical protein
MHQMRFLALTLRSLVGDRATGRARDDDPRGSPVGAPPRAAAKAAEGGTTPAAGRMFVVGRALDPERP